MNIINYIRPLRAGLLLACVLTLLLLLGGCAPSEELRKEWAKKVESGEYGWIDFNSGETRNLDSYPQARVEMLRNTLYPEYSQDCFEQLRDYGGRVSVEIHFLLSRTGHPSRFIIVSDRAVACSRDVVDALRSFSLLPGRRDGEPVVSVGEYTHTLSPAGGYRGGN